MLTISWRSHRMFTRQVPASTILVDAQSMAGRDMPSEHLAAQAAFEADDVIAINRSPNRHRGCPLDLAFSCRFAEAGDDLMHRRDQDRELVGPNLVLPNIGGDNPRSEFSTDRCRR